MTVYALDIDGNPTVDRGDILSFEIGLLRAQRENAAYAGRQNANRVEVFTARDSKSSGRFFGFPLLERNDLHIEVSQVKLDEITSERGASRPTMSWKRFMSAPSTENGGHSGGSHDAFITAT